MDPVEGRLIRLPLRQGAFSADAVFKDMLTGWKQQQLARNFTAGTIRGRESLVRRFVDHTRHFPWEWTVGDADEFFAHERSILNLAFATIRAYQTHLKVFCDFLTDPVYEWDRICIQGFGRSPAQIITEFNRARHAQNNEQAPTKRPFTRAELQGFFDLADLEVERVLASGRKGAVAAYRDATVFKTTYAWGLRANEVTHLQTVDFSRNRRAPQFGEFGVLQVRYGKAQRGSPPKRRSVLTVFDWSPAVLDTWIRSGLPWLAPAVSEIFPTANGLPVPKSNLHRRFRDYIDELGYPPGLDIHSLRRSYVTHLFEHFGFDHTFVQRQVGHEHASTTSLYTSVSSDYQTSELNRVLEDMIEKAVRPKEEPK